MSQKSNFSFRIQAMTNRIYAVDMATSFLDVFKACFIDALKAPPCGQIRS